MSWDDLADTATTALNKIIATIKTTVSGFRWANAGEIFGNTLNSLFSGTNWTELGQTAAAAIAGPLDTIKNAVKTFSFGDAAEDFAKTVNGFFSNEQMWADAGTIVSDSIKGLFTWGADFLNGLNTEQISKDIKVAISKMDWAGIADAIWKFLKAAISALGKGISDLLSPIQEEADDYDIVIGATGEVYFVPKPGEGLHTEGDHWELDEKVDADANVSPTKSDNWEQEWSDLVGDELPIPVDPTLPDDAGKVIEDEWAAQGVTLEAEAGIKTTAQQLGDKLRGVWDKVPNSDKTVTAMTALKKGTAANGTQTVAPLYSSQDKLVGGLTKLTKGDNKDGAQKVNALYSADEKSVTGKTHLEQGDKKDGLQKVTSVYSADEKTVTGKTHLEQGNKNDGAQKVTSVYSADDKSVTGKTHLEQGNKNDGAQKVASVYSAEDKSVTGKTHLKQGGKKDGPQKADPLYSDSDKKVTAKVSLTKGWSGSDPLSSLNLTNLTTTVKVFIEKAGSTWQKIKDFLKNLGINIATGGVIANGMFSRFASGGVISGGMVQYLKNVPHYAGGTTRAHGTVFVAGEAGPEIMGHINGRTEILNKAQLAQTMYSAVISAMGQAISALGSFLSAQMAECTNAITSTISNVGGISGLRSLEYHVPAMASGTVLPYEVAAQIARTSTDIQNTLDANNEDLIQTIISVIGAQTSAIVAALRANPQNGSASNGLTTQQLINDINRRARMFGSSPVLN